MDKIIDKQGNTFTTTEIDRFNEKYLAIFKQLSELSIAKKKIVEKEKEIKKDLKNVMEEYNIKSIDNEYIRISYVAPGKPSVKVDLKSLKEEDSLLYDDLLNRFPKHIKGRASYISFRLKNR